MAIEQGFVEPRPPAAGDGAGEDERCRPGFIDPAERRRFIVASPRIPGLPGAAAVVAAIEAELGAAR